MSHEASAIADNDLEVSLKPRDQHPLAGIALRVVGMACVAIMLALAKACGSRGVPVFELVFFRNLFAFLPLIVQIWISGGVRILATRRPVAHLIRAAIGITGLIASFIAVRHLPLIETTAITYTSPMFMVSLSALLLRERVTWRTAVAVAVGFVGVLVMAQPEPGHFNMVGVSWAVLSAVATAGVTIAVRQIATTEPAPTIVFYFLLAGALLGLVVTSLTGWFIPDPETLAMLIGAGLVGGLGQLLFTAALKLAPVGLLAPFDYTQLVWASLFGFLVWGDQPRLNTFVGGVIVAAAGLYTLQREIRRCYRPSAASSTH